MQKANRADVGSDKPTSVEDYIKRFPTKVQMLLEQVRAVIKKTASTAEESISYAMPAYKLNGKPLVYFAGYENHIGFYALPSGHAQFAKQLSIYKQGKGSVQFPLGEPLPLDLIAEIVKFNMSKILLNTNVGSKKKAASTSPELLDEIAEYNASLELKDAAVADILSAEISKGLKNAESKIWHRHPVWFLDGNPIVGYSKQKAGMRLMFWSGADFDEDALAVKGAKFKDASIFYNDVSEIIKKDLKRWLKKSKEIQWDYKDLVKRKGRLERLK